MGVNYANTQCYKIVSKQTDKIYIGMTTQTLANRLSGHKSKYRQYTTGDKKTFCSSSEILKYGDAEIVFLFNCPCNSKEEVSVIERETIIKNNCVNQHLRQTKKQIVENISKCSKGHYQNNKQAINDRRNQRMECDCGGRYTLRNKAVHFKSQIHIRYETLLHI